MSHEIILFGCIGRAGHFFHAPNGYFHYDRFKEIPWGYDVDCGILKRHKIPDNPNGTMAFEQLNGWSIVSFWDRSGDSRPGSNTAFLVHALTTPKQIVNLAMVQWPSVFSRRGFPSLQIEIQKEDFPQNVQNAIDELLSDRKTG